MPEPETRLFAYDEWRILGAYEADGAAVQETVWLGDLPIATVRGGQVYHVHTDHLGTPRAVTDPATGTEVWRWDSDPFGRAEENEDPDGDGEEFTYNLRFPGQYYDGETGKHYNYFRDYDPSTGRYITADPIGLVPGLSSSPTVPSRIMDYMRSVPLNVRLQRGLNHPYVYVENRPINLIDPFGLYGTSDCSYYERRCEQVGGVYYCYVAPSFCKTWPDGEWSNCVRQCLQEFDYGYCETDNTCGGSDVPCVVNIHQMCWQECLGGGPPQTYPAGWQ